ncbi:MAG TPA: Gfo/Idh/MocA family oxidoreductase [Propionibacteriaceae bacterium]|nr:Gfo/Idh/MocA family oxidoreductase [Propionibacteriaceae bacterium]
MTAVRVGLVGAGRIGTSHAGFLTTAVHGADLVAVADPRPGAAEALTRRVGGEAWTDVAAMIGSDLDAVVVTASSTAHAELVVAAAEAGKAVFCEKPMSMTLAEIGRVAAAVQRADVVAQVGFNRRFDAGFAAAHETVVSGRVGTPQLLRSVTRDPGLADPGSVPPWTIFTQTLIHDFDTVCWLAGSEPVEVYASADALVAPEFKDQGLLDTAVVLITFANGARAMAEASFSAVYGYDVRGEVFGSAGMVTVGDGARTTLQLSDAHGRHRDTAHSDVELLRDAYISELSHFVNCVRDRVTPSPTVADARRALAVALACIESYQDHAPAAVQL